MPDHQRVIEFLRDVRQAGAASLQTVTPEITQMATDYAALCTQANERLRQCSAFLQQGLRTEAIHLAEAQPNLLDLVAQLDLPDPQSWADFCTNNGLPVPPPLQLDRAAQLNDAYSQDQPLEMLLSRHRLLALSRAPVRERLHVMREIQQMDAGNAYWEKDIRAFEKARLKELPISFYAAVKNHDDQQISDLMTEISQEPWFEPVPADLTAAVSDAHARIRRTAVEAELQKLVEPLRDAYAARSLQECQALVQQWKNVMASGGVANISPELLDEIKPVVAFVNEQSKKEELSRRYKESCKNFVKLLDIDAPDAQLESGYARLQEFNEEIPADITQRLQAKLAARRKAADQRHKTRLLAIGVSAVAVIVIGLVVLMLYMRAAAAGQWADKIHRAIAEHSPQGLTNAQHYVDELRKTNAALLAQPVVAKEVNDLKTQQDQLARDQAAVQSRIAKLDAAKTAAAGATASLDASLHDITAAAATLQSAINEAKSSDISWADPDNRLPVAINDVQGAVSALRDRLTASVQTELDAIATRLRAIPAAASTPEIAAQAAEAIAALQVRITPLREISLVDEKTKADVIALADQITQRRQGAESSSGVAGELQNIRLHAATPAELKQALQQFITRFPNDPRTPDFKTAIDRLPLAVSLDAWLQLASTFDNKFAASTASATQKRLDAVTAFLSAHPESPVTAAATKYTDYLHHALDALADKGTWQNGLADLLATPLLTDLNYMEVSDGRRFYTLGDPKRAEHKFNNQISVVFETINLKDFTQRIPITIDSPLTVSAKPIPAPHTKVVTDIGDDLKLINDTNWETFGIDLVDQLQRNTQVDLIVKAILVQQILKTQITVTPGLADLYERSLTELSRQTPDQLPWLDPPRISNAIRGAIKSALDGIPPAATARQKLAAADAALFKSLTLDRLGTGVLLKDDSGAWSVSTRVTPVEGAKVWLIVPPGTATAPTTSSADPAPAVPVPASDSGPSLMLIGTATANNFTLTNVPPTPQGSLIYIARP